MPLQFLRRLSLALLSGFSFFLLLPRPAFAQAPLLWLNVVFGRLISTLITFAGFAFLFMLVVSGYHYLNAGANKESAARAQNSLTWALVGLILAISAWAILSLAGNFLGTNLRIFSICITPNCL